MDNSRKKYLKIQAWCKLLNRNEGRTLMHAANYALERLQVLLHIVQI
jgi:hypothetical protein